MADHKNSKKKINGKKLEAKDYADPPFPRLLPPRQFHVDKPVSAKEHNILVTAYNELHDDLDMLFRILDRAKSEG